MLKKPMTYTDIDGNVVTEDFYFSMTKAELLKLEFSEDEGLSEKIKRIQKPDAKGREVLEVFDAIIGYSYGIRRDGKFVKPASAFEEFKTTEAYSNLLFEIATDANKAAQFVNEIMPPALLAEVQKEVEAAKMQGVTPSQVIVDEAAEVFQPRSDLPPAVEIPKIGPGSSKEDILFAMKAKSFPRALTMGEVTAWSEQQLQIALAAGCTIEV